MTERSYLLTEEIARQTVEVIFNVEEKEEWFICFSNPTAGPWKLVKIYNPARPDEPEIAGSYLKEEKRPDLVLYSYKHKIFILLEAKKNVTELFSRGQIEKTIKMFDAEIAKLKAIPQISQEIESGETYTFITGFLYPSHDPVNDLKTFHKSFVEILSEQTTQEIHEYITFIISPLEDKSLKAFWHLASVSGQEPLLTKILSDSFPTGVTQ